MERHLSRRGEVPDRARLLRKLYEKIEKLSNALAFRESLFVDTGFDLANIEMLSEDSRNRENNTCLRGVSKRSKAIHVFFLKKLARHTRFIPSLLDAPTVSQELDIVFSKSLSTIRAKTFLNLLMKVQIPVEPGLLMYGGRSVLQRVICTKRSHCNVPETLQRFNLKFDVCNMAVIHDSRHCRCSTKCPSM